MLLHLVKGLIDRQNCILYSALHFLRQKLDWQSIPQGHEIPIKYYLCFLRHEVYLGLAHHINVFRTRLNVLFTPILLEKAQVYNASIMSNAKQCPCYFTLQGTNDLYY